MPSFKTSGIADLVKAALSLGQPAQATTGVTFSAGAALLGRPVAVGLLVGDLSRCDACYGLVFKADQEGHAAWHTQVALAAARPLYGDGDYQVATREQLAAGK